MKKIIYTLLFFSFCNNGLTQVGIGTNTPDNSAMLEVQSTQKGILFPRMTSIQRTSISSPVSGLYVYDTNTKSLWHFNGTVWINTVSESSLGDVKSGFQTADHAGWILLDGRAVNTLTTNQQAIAVSLGFTVNLPNATSAYLVQNNAAIGTVAGANTTTLAQANLPNVNFSGVAASAGDHAHVTDPAAVNAAAAGNHNHTTDPSAIGTTVNGNHSHGHNAPGGYGNYGLALSNYNNTVTGTDGSPNELNVWMNPGGLNIYDNGNHQHSVDIPSTASSTDGSHQHSVDIPATTSTTAGAHVHTVSVASGGSATPINIAPKSLTVNMFVYLGL